jgi:predicted nucleotidyltransferase
MAQFFEKGEIQMKSKHISPCSDKVPGQPIRLRDFVEDTDGWLYAVSVYDNEERVGGILRYVPDPAGERVGRGGRRYKKLDFNQAYEMIASNKPRYLDLVHRVPRNEIRRVLKPENEIQEIAERNQLVKRLMKIFDLPHNSLGCTGSFLCELEQPESDIDLVIYGRSWVRAQEILRDAIKDGYLQNISEEVWLKIYEKRRPDISFEAFIAHEKRKVNRGQIEGTYFDLLYTRSYEDIGRSSPGRGRVLGSMRIEAKVTDASLSFDNPAVYEVEHDRVTRVLSFTHTYSGQAITGETIEARGVLEEHGEECWLIVGTTREARGEYIISKTLLESSDVL